MFNIFICASVISYIRDLKNCDCFHKLNKTENINIQYVYVIEIIILIVSIINIIPIITIYFKSKNKIGGKSNLNNLKQIQNISNYISIFIYILFAGLGIYLIINLYKLVKLDDPKCECINEWTKNVIYIQLVILIFGILFVYPYQIYMSYMKIKN